MSEKLVIFDCDGVLIDGEPIVNRIFTQTLVGYGYPITEDECIRRFTGLNEHDCRKIVMQELGIYIPETYWEELKPVVFDAFRKGLPGLQHSLLAQLSSNNIARCVASNSSLSYLNEVLELTGQRQYFADDAIFSAEQVAKPKPAPDVFLHAARTMGYKPENCIVIEDSATGAKAALAAGMQVLLFVGASHARHDWYRNSLAEYNRPMCASSDELALGITHIMSAVAAMPAIAATP